MKRNALERSCSHYHRRRCRRGIGRAVAVGLAREGASIGVADIDFKGAPDTAAMIEAEGGRAFAIQGDVSISRDVRRMVEETAAVLGEIDILFNNAGFCTFVPFLDVPEDLWDRTMAVNVKGYFLMAQTVAARMVNGRRGGKIINVSSISAEVAGEEKVHYCASKGAVKLLPQGMALELARHGIQVNAVAPATIDTDIVRETRIQQLVEVERSHSSIPAGRIGIAEDLVGAAIFLASSESDYVTEATLLADGGSMAGSNLPAQFRARP